VNTQRSLQSAIVGRSIYDYGVHAGYEYLVMEYLPRGDLKARMQQGLTDQEALRYVAQIAAALECCTSMPDFCTGT